MLINLVLGKVYSTDTNLDDRPMLCVKRREEKIAFILFSIVVLSSFPIFLRFEYLVQITFLERRGDDFLVHEFSSNLIFCLSFFALVSWAMENETRANILADRSNMQI